MANRTDSFTRGDSSTSLGAASDGLGSWTALSGTWGVSSGQAYLATGAGSFDVAYLESSLTGAFDVTAVLAVAEGSSQGLAGKVIDDSNYVLTRWTGGVWQVTQKVAGTFAQLGTDLSTTAPANGDTLKLSFTGTNSVGVYLNSVQLGTTQTYDSSLQSATKAGLFVGSGAATARWDTFAITSGAPAATTYTLSPSPSPVSVGNAVTVTLTPNGTSAVTVTVTPSGSASTGLTAQTATFDGTSAAKTVSFTPTVTGTLTLTPTNGGSLANPSAANVTVNSGPVTIPVTDANFYFCPGGWYSDGGGSLGANNIKGSSTYALTNAPGNYFRAGFTGTSAALGIGLNGATGAEIPSLAWRVDGGAWQTSTPTAGDTTVTLATGLASGTHQLFFTWYFQHEGIDCWTLTSTPYSALKVTGLVVDGGSASAAPAGANAVRSKRALFVGDSNVMGNSSTTTGTSDSRNSWVAEIGEALDAEAGWAGHGSSAYVTAVGSPTNVPVADTILTSVADSKPRNFGNAFDHVFLCHGAKDAQLGTAQATVQHALYNTGASGECLPDARSSAASAWIWVVVPTCRNSTVLAALTAAVAAFGDAKCKLIDAGASLAAGLASDATASTQTFASYDQVHMIDRTHARFAAKVAAAVVTASTPAGGCVFSRSFTGY